MRRVFDTDALAAAFPFTSPDLPLGTGDAGMGVLFGLNLASSGVVVWDRWAQDNYNAVILARSGAGKSYLAKLDLLRNLYLGVYTADPDRYLIGATYTLTLAEPDERPLSLNLEDWELLAHCLELVVQRWGEAIEQADAGAETAHHAPARPEQAGTITVEPTPTGYRAMGQMFRDELDRVQRLRRRVGQLLHQTDHGQEGEPS